MDQKTALEISQIKASGYEFADRIQMSIKKSQETGRPFLVLVMQLANMAVYKKRRPPHVVSSLYRELQRAVRNAVHPSQYVGIFQDGLGLVFDAADVGQADTMAKRLVAIAQNVIRSGKYNDLSSRWTDIIQQFLLPNNPGIIFPKVGWGVYPRDGAGPKELVTRAFHHIIELSR